MDELTDWISGRLQEGIRKKLFPGGVAGIMLGGETAMVYEGTAFMNDDRIPVSNRHIYDIASLTKVIATLPAVLISIQNGRLALDDPAVMYLPELTDGNQAEGKEQMTIFHLLTHTAGLPGWRPYYIYTNSPEEYLRAISRESLLARPGEEVIYSDLGFILLGFILERIWNERLDMLVQKLIFKPLGMKDTGYLPSREKLRQIVPTETGNAIEAKMASDHFSKEGVGGEGLLQQAEIFHWRKGVIRGTVHDCNAHFGLNGISGHAGLFSTLDDLLIFMGAWNGEDDAFIGNSLKKVSAMNQTLNCGSKRGLGWDKPDGELFTPLAFGHTGFTGTSIWSDPGRELTAITLTNRVHCYQPEAFLNWRKQYHEEFLAKIPPRGERSGL